MANMIYTTYQTNSYKIIKSTFNTYELPHAPVIFSINFGVFNCFEILTEPKISDKLCRFTEGEGGGGGGCPPAPPEFPPLLKARYLIKKKECPMPVVMFKKIYSSL